MKLSTTTLLAVLLSSTAVFAAPTPITAEKVDTSALIKKSDVNDVMAIIEQLGENKRKRDLIEDENELMDLSKRDESLLSQLIVALQNSGLISDIWKILTTDQTLKTLVVGLVKKAVQGAITEGPALIQAIWQSGLLQSIFKNVFQNSELRPVLFSIAKSIFSSGLNLLKLFLASKTGGTTSTASTAAKRDAMPDASYMVDLSDFNTEEYLDKRDALAVAELIYTAIKNTGLVQGLVQKALADPQASISLLTTVLKKGWVLGEDIYSWANQAGLIKSGLTWIAANGATYASEVAQFIGKLITSGKATVADVDNAQPLSSYGISATSTATAAPAATGTAATSTATKQKRRYY